MRELNAKRVIIKMVDGTEFDGQVNIGGARRVSDFVRRSEGSFMVLFDATKNSESRKDVYFLNLSHVLWMQPEDMVNTSSSNDFVAIALDRDHAKQT